MGQHEAMFDALNWLGRRGGPLPEEFEFSSDDDLVVSARKLMDAMGNESQDSINMDSVELMSALPDVMADVLIRVVRTASKNGRQVRWVWKPGYDFELNITQARTGSVAVVVSSPYPDELQPFDA